MALKELDVFKLEVLNEVGDRNFVIPAEVRGFFHKRKKIVHFILMLFFLALPWIRVNGQQLIHLDITHRRFYIFGLNLASHDAPLIFIFLILATLMLAYVTALWGRVWCGWACPQTVFIEFVYRQIEIWVEGPYLARRSLRQQTLNLNKFLKVSCKWTLFFIVSSLFAHSFAAYFVGRDELLKMMALGPSHNLTYFTLITGFTLLLLFNFGWFREQFCLIACPYGRIQSVLMDQDSLSVVYDTQRGEPRKGTTRGAQTQGDCISCFKCVAVCPTGIDIRNGQQMECIGCTACIDACDEIMTKVNKATGLIRYDNLSRKKISIFKGRPAVYFFGILISFSALIFFLSERPSLDVTLLRAIEAPYQTVTTPTGVEIINHFRLRVKNQWNTSAEAALSLNTNDIELISGEKTFSLKPLELKTVHFFIKFKPGLTHQSEKKDIEVIVTNTKISNANFPQKLEVLEP